ncbi:four-carbon acid sugar kinase family protein [Halomonas sp. TRM85114]|uniref:3-oxo-tetronate kinase n=1 Tax=Halomonas jincaotanensis TaxID=2810616 RepID=UPI001BD3D25D|nr:3-oxo-tetronate kinase [Halomonas jincaotanensis]MBS9402326.1 four-carbon acid sugar kinase family protein [Halomonas jincaotanensis]
MAIVLGAIADDFTGATDLANNLVRAGMRCVQVIGVPDPATVIEDVDAVVVALKSRACPADEAVADSLAALDWLQAQGARQLFFKYCSTFDSTDAGNIGPVADALLERLRATETERLRATETERLRATVTERLGGSQTVMVPAFPINGRTVYQGHLFVGDRLLNDSGMQHHPLNPMRDADLVRVLGRQTPHPVGLAARPTLVQGGDATRRHLQALAAEGIRHVICDTLDEDDLAVLAEAVVDMPLVTGGSGLGQALPAQYRRWGWLDEVTDPGRLVPASGAALVLSGSCSRATLGQVDHFLERHPGFALEPLALAEGDAHLQAALSFARERLADGGPVLVYASADPERVKAAQAALGVERAGQLVEAALGELASTLVGEGVGRLIVAGGESSGAVVSALGVTMMRIGEQIDPGVPWTQAPLPGRSDSNAPLSLALKSGNFGGKDFFTRAFDVLPTGRPS